MTEINKSVVEVKKEPHSEEVLYKEFKQEINKISLTEGYRNKLVDLFVEALNLMPQEQIEKTPVEENNVVCKLFLKGFPNVLEGTIGGILKSLAIKNKNGFTDYEKTSEYVMTLLLEKVKKA